MDSGEIEYLFWLLLTGIFVIIFLLIFYRGD